MALIPVRGLHGGKSRLAPALRPDERSAIIAAMARRVVSTVLDSGIVDSVMIVTREPDLAGSLGINDPRLSLGLQLADAMGLNAAIDIGRAVAVERAVTRLVVLSADLPTLMTSDLQVLDTEWTDVVLAPDRAGTGTNALMLRGDRAIRSFGARFGIGSCALHVAEAERHGLTWSDIAIPGIAYDLDSPEDWQGLPGHLRQALLQEGHARIAGRHATRSTSIPHVMEHA